jgi:hypothetical protein
MSSVNLLYELPSGRIITIYCDLGSLDNTCDNDLTLGQEIWAINYWEVEDEGDELDSLDQCDIDNMCEIELLECARLNYLRCA